MGTQPEIGHTAERYLPRIKGGVMISEIKSASMSHINESSRLFSCDFKRCLLSFVYMYFISVELRSFAVKNFQNFAKFTATNMQIKE